LDADGGCDSAVTARVRSAFKKFREYIPILIGKGFSLKLKGNVYATCVSSCLMHGSETWPMEVEHELKVNRTEMSRIRWMCGVKLNERKKSEELRELLGLEPVSLMIKKSRRWFGHVERKDDNDWVKRCITWEVERNQTEDTRKRPGGIVLRMTWKACPKRMHSSRINGEGELRAQSANPGSPEKWPLKWNVCVCVCVYVHSQFN